MKNNYRIKEYKVLFYRIILVYLFYFIARFLFFIFNKDLLEVDSILQFFKICYHGLTFDTTAILYVNSLFILLSLFPLFINTRPLFQKVLFYIYFSTNLIAYATNFGDIIYYKFSNFRLTTAVLNEFKGETNGSALALSFLKDYWFVLLLFILVAYIWIRLYKKINMLEEKITYKLKYVGLSIIVLLLSVTLMIGGIRGDLSTVQDQLI